MQFEQWKRRGMNEKKKTNWIVRIFTGLILLASNLITGAALGLLWVRLFVDVDMGLGGVADALGGVMVGMLLALVVSALMVFLLSVRMQWVWIGIAVVIVGVMFVWLRLTAPVREISSEPILKEKFRPSFILRMNLSQSQEVLAAATPDERLFPFVEAEVRTSRPELIYVGWGPDFERCVAAPSHADLEVLLPLVQEVMAAAGPDCRTPEDDLSLSVRWNLENNLGSQTLDAGCLPDQPEFMALTDAVGALADRLCEAESVAPTTSALTPIPKTAPITFKGKVSRNQIFEEEVLNNLTFRLDPLEQGWEIWMGDKSETGHNFSSVATPPFHGINARFIEGWNFRNSDNSGPNKAGEKNVNAPQYERRFCFFQDESDYQIAYYWLNNQLLSSEEERQENKEKFSMIKSRTGILRINNLELGNLIVNDRAWIEDMEFEVELNLTDECAMF
jgi:hypothetical protein